MPSDDKDIHTMAEEQPEKTEAFLEASQESTEACQSYL